MRRFKSMAQAQRFLSVQVKFRTYSGLAVTTSEPPIIASFDPELLPSGGRRPVPLELATRSGSV